MTGEQVASLARTIGTIAGTLLIAKGVTDNAGAAALSNALGEAAGAVFVVGSQVWSLWTKTRSATVAKAAALPGVARVVVTDQKVADAIPSSKVVGPQGL